ncbi:MAG: hypothetical protein ACI4AQ_03870 [Lachnospiraceae bacterium]
MDRIILKKQNGTAGIFNFVPMIMTVILCGYLLINSGYYMRYLDFVIRLENLTKKYVLIMETENGLTVQRMSEMYIELNSLGIQSEDIDLTGTTFATENVMYGEEIYLNLKVQIPYNELSLDDNWKKNILMKKKEVEMRQCTLALGSS